MSLRNTQTDFGAVAKGFHWIMAIMIASMFVLGIIMVDMPLSLEKLQWINWHKSLGVTVFAVLVGRAIWRMVSKPPQPHPNHKPWEKRLAHGVHMAFYGLMIAMPITGWLMSSAAGYSVSVWGWFTLPDLIASNKENQDLLVIIHEVLAYSFLGLIGLHVAGAVKHHIIDKDSTLKRMLPFTGKPKSVLTEREVS